MRILVLCLPGIGDALMATPMINVLKTEMPEATIDVACMFNEVSLLFKNNKNIVNSYNLDIYKRNRIIGIKNILPLRKNKYDISILPLPAYRREYHVVQWLVGAKRRFAHRLKKGYWSELHFLNTDLISVDETVHNVINNVNILKPLGIQWEKKYKKDDFRYDLVLDKKDVAFGNNYLTRLGWKKKDIVGIHPGSINSPAGILKRWPIDRFAEIAAYLIRRKKKILIFFGPFEVELGKKLFSLINDSQNCRLIESTTFGQSLGILEKLSLLISNDNGFAHLANALKVRSVILFGPTNTKWCSPYNKALVVTIQKATFAPWFRNDIKVTNPPRGAKSGMEEITVEDVIEKIK